MLRVVGERDVTGAVDFRNAGERRMDNKNGKLQVWMEKVLLNFFCLFVCNFLTVSSFCMLQLVTVKCWFEGEI